jgi:hypothetical protein
MGQGQGRQESDDGDDDEHFQNRESAGEIANGGF